MNYIGQYDGKSTQEPFSKRTEGFNGEHSTVIAIKFSSY